jgi:hypothetical protein
MSLDEKSQEHIPGESPGKENIPPEFIIQSSTEETKHEWLQRKRVEVNGDENRRKIIELLLAKYAKGSEKYKKSNNAKRVINVLAERGFSYDDAFELIFLLYE